MLRLSCSHWTIQDLRIDDITGNSSREGAARDVLVIIFDQDAVVSWQDRQVGHSARPILVVHTADVRLGWTLNGQRQTTYKTFQEQMVFLYD